MGPLPLLHVLNLDTIGGVESLYTHFLQKSFEDQFLDKALNYTIVSGKKAHPIYGEKISQIGLKKPFHEQYIFGIRVPKLFRGIKDIRRGMIESIFHGYVRWVFWNRIEEGSAPNESIYYEHGASWMTEPSPKQETFMKSQKKIIANSHAAQIILSQLWTIPKESISFIENPLRPDIQIIEHPRTLASSKRIRLGYIGRLQAIKAPGLTLHLVKNLLDKNIDVTLDIAGIGPEKPFLEELAKKMGIAQRVRFLDTVTSVSEFYDGIDLAIIPSIREPLGLVALEASARGIPVLATCVDGLFESVKQNRSGILVSPSLEISEHYKEFISKMYGLPTFVVNPITMALTEPKFVDPTLLTESVLKLLESPEEYLRLSTGGLHTVSLRSDFNTYTTNLIDALITPPLEMDEEEED